MAKTGQEIANDRIRVNNLTTGGATTNLVNCPSIVTSTTGAGYFYANPTYTLDLSGIRHA